MGAIFRADQGICLLFRRDAFEPLVLAQLQQRSPGARAGAVRYSKAGLAESPATTLLQREGIPGASLAQEHVRRFAQEFFFSKLIAWEGEHEYRFIEPGDDEDYSYVDIGDSLVSVIVGHEFPTWQEPAARTICHEAGRLQSLASAESASPTPGPMRMLSVPTTIWV